MKDRALPLLMFMVLKINGDLKTRVVSNGIKHLLCTNKNDFISLTSNFYALKHVCAEIDKEGRHTIIACLTCFFLQIERDGE